MSERRSFYRKVLYGVAIAVLLIPLYQLSAPATQTEPGGTLAQLRSEHDLAQTDLGDVDPASETIKLATLGLRGIAVNLLWEKANYYKKTEDWTNLTATLEQLAKLQPNFITFWKFQAWNLSYNVSVEFDDYHDRYYYVRRGIEFLKEGERYNRDNPQLLWDLGWFIGQKIGRADEHVQYRRLFKADDDFHPPERSLDDRDNWLVGKEWYKKAIDAVDKKGKDLGRKSPRIFYASPAMSQMNYAEAIEEEGYFEKAGGEQGAWAQAAEDWRRFGELPIEHSTGVVLRLGSEAELQEQVDKLREQFDEIMTGARESLEAERKAALSDEERTILDTPLEDLTEEQEHELYQIREKLNVSHRDVADWIARAEPERANQARRMAFELERQERRLRFTSAYKRDSNFEYWKTRAEFEQTEDALTAREKMFLARQALRDGDLLTAKRLYEEGFDKWQQVINAFPAILEDELLAGDDLIDYTLQYKEVLDQLDERLPDNPLLWQIIKLFDRDQKLSEELAEHEQRQQGVTTEPDEAATEP